MHMQNVKEEKMLKVPKTKQWSTGLSAPDMAGLSGPKQNVAKDQKEAKWHALRCEPENSPENSRSPDYPVHRIIRSSAPPDYPPGRRKMAKDWKATKWHAHSIGPEIWAENCT